LVALPRGACLSNAFAHALFLIAANFQQIAASITRTIRTIRAHREKKIHSAVKFFDVDVLLSQWPRMNHTQSRPLMAKP
jgi:hypothetical protein